jgi:hypothetical protein
VADPGRWHNLCVARASECDIVHVTVTCVLVFVRGVVVFVCMYVRASGICCDLAGVAVLLAGIGRFFQAGATRLVSTLLTAYVYACVYFWIQLCSV